MSETRTTYVRGNVRVVAAIPVWNEDANTIAGALASCRPLHASFKYLGGVGDRPDDRFPNHLELRKYGIEYAKQFHAADWVIQLDADERLCNGERLVDFLQTYPGWAFPIPLIQENGQVTWAPFKVIRSDCELVYRMEYVERNGQIFCLTGYPSPSLDDFPVEWPYIYHAPSLRKGERANDRLSAIEERTDPSPPESELYYPPLMKGNTMSEGIYEVNDAGEVTSEAQYYCPGCGLRYDAPGNCTGSAESGHEPIAVEKVKDAGTTGKPDDSWTVANITAYAESHGISLDGSKTKAEKLAVIETHEGS